MSSSRSCRVLPEVSGSRRSLSGGRSRNRCSCRQIEHQTAEAIARGVRLVRFRFSLPRGELPEPLRPGDLDKWLRRLLRPGPGPGFPRVQRGWDERGFPNLVRLGRRERWSFAASLASIKRGLRFGACRMHPPPSAFGEWSARVSQDPPPVDPDYLRFVRKVVRAEFRFGWDEGLYESFVDSFIPRNSARYEAGTGALDQWRNDRCEMGVSAPIPLHDPQFSKEDFERVLRSGRPVPGEPDGSRDFLLRYKEIPTVGKVRPLGIPTPAWDLLGPLHKSIYQRLTSRRWCLRGSPTPSRISKVCTADWQTSVDLVSATDNLPVEVAETILGALLSKATRVPGPIKVLAFESLRPVYTGPGGVEGQVLHGQMMGTYLSFPLLCLQSYCMARWAVRDQGKRARFLVNGDDAVISCDRPVVASDYPPFAILNDGKTMRASRAVEINSTQFLWVRRKGWVTVPVLRRGAGYADPSGVRHLATACVNAGPKWQDAFVKLRLDGSIQPRELGLSLRVRGVFLRERSLLKTRFRTPPPPREVSSHWDLLPEPPSEAGLVAFRRELWRVGRTSDKLPDLDWSAYRWFYYRPRPIRLTQLSYTRALRLDGTEHRRREKLWCHAPEFVDNVSLPDVVSVDGEAFLVFPS
nr:MAG: hypothetical protein [Botourmiaviridae sp.]